MREITYKDMIIRDLSQLNKWKFSVMQEAEELVTLEQEYAAVKATNYDKMPGGSGDNIQEEKLITVIAKKEQLKAELEFNKRRIADIERILEKLPDDDRQIVDRMIINDEKYAADRLAQELGYEIRQIYNKRNSAIRQMALLRYGASYRP